MRSRCSEDVSMLSTVFPARRPRCEDCLVADLCPSRALFLGV